MHARQNAERACQNAERARPVCRGSLEAAAHAVYAALCVDGRAPLQLGVYCEGLLRMRAVWCDPSVQLEGVQERGRHGGRCGVHHNRCLCQQQPVCREQVLRERDCVHVGERQAGYTRGAHGCDRLVCARVSAVE